VIETSDSGRGWKTVRIVELRFIAGLTVEETVEIVHVSHTTIKRESAMARARLFRELTDGGAVPD
jgi:DNA-directed RNA polymerase specialized sigma24 family protein